MEALNRCWFPVAWSADLGSKPFPAEVLGKRVVAFRDEQGHAHVLNDMCPHKNVRLSCGLVENGRILCPYHGWAFDGTGRCVDIPSLPRGEPVPSHIETKSYRVVEQQNTVWFSFSDEPYQPKPPDWYYLDVRAFTTVIDMNCEYIRLMENLIDNPHAGYLHAGLLRGRPSREVTALTRETEAGVHVATSGESARRSMIYRMLRRSLPGDAPEIVHTEEYVEPNIIRTIFSDAEERTHVSSQFVCVPVNERKTRLFYRITLKFPVIAPLLLPFLKLMADRVIRQDRAMLEHEAAIAWEHPELKRITAAADLPSIWMAKAARHFAQHGPVARSKLRQKEIKYRL